ncbi:hypothetical protein [Methylobacterium sp. J-070]|uniref:hypothetical protein n=1 Tax=Methylobacterium sp. J-070 TaxID=2836650 RepID=UPI001FBB9CD6|nr:hypothetical protein [Methylobacterium sp. J-070]MCJ2050875.1 hypothetical protein [Methylobacterium sp. J-070]
MEQREAVARGLDDRKSVGRPKSIEKSVKMQITMPSTLAAKLDDIRLLTHHTSTPDLIRRAIVFYSAAIRQHQKGGRVIFQDPDGREVEMSVTI